MAKRRAKAAPEKAAPEKAGPRSEAGGGEFTTVSTRFDELELRLLREAAERRRWSLAQFVRVAAKEKAAHVLNSSGSALVGVHQVLRGIVHQFHDPEPLFLDEVGREVTLEDVECQTGPLFQFRGSPIDHELFTDFILIIRRLGSELADLLEASYDHARDNATFSLKALIDPADPVLAPSNLEARAGHFETEAE